MKWEEWLDLKSIKALSQHGSATLTAFLLFALLGYALDWVPLPDVVRSTLKGVDDIVLVGLVLWFVWQMALVLWKGRIRNGSANSLLVA
jgi:hypothetical protein